MAGIINSRIDDIDEVSSYDPTKAKRGESVEEKVARLSSAGSPIVQLNQTQARQSQNARGILNSQGTIGQVVKAGIETATPIAMADVENERAYNLNDADSQNRAYEFGATSSNASRLQRQRERQDATNIQLGGIEERKGIIQSGIEARKNIEASGTQDRLNIGAQGDIDLMKIDRQGLQDRFNINEQGKIDITLMDKQGLIDLAKIAEQGVQSRLNITAEGMERLKQINAQGLADLANISAQGNIDLSKLDKQGLIDLANIAAQGSIDINKIRASGLEDRLNITAEGVERLNQIDRQGLIDLANIAANGDIDLQKLDAQGLIDLANIAAQGSVDLANIDAGHLASLAEIGARGVEDRLLELERGEQDRATQADRYGFESDISAQESQQRQDEMFSGYTYDRLLQNLKGDQAERLTEIETRSQQLIQGNASAAATFSTFSESIAEIMANPDITGEAKEALVNKQIGLLENAMVIQSELSGMNLAGLLSWPSGNTYPNQDTGGGDTGGGQTWQGDPLPSIPSGGGTFANQLDATFRDMGLNSTLQGMPADSPDYQKAVDFARYALVQANGQDAQTVYNQLTRYWPGHSYDGFLDSLGAYGYLVDDAGKLARIPDAATFAAAV